MEEKVTYNAVGRRKEAVARIRLVPGTGTIVVNKTALDTYFTRETDRILVKQPLLLTNSAAKFDIYANLKGGGLTGQAGAMRHGIARALVLSDPALRDLLHKHKFLRRDPRMKERKKYGQKGARKRFQWTKR